METEEEAKMQARQVNQEKLQQERAQYQDMNDELEDARREAAMAQQALKEAQAEFAESEVLKEKQRQAFENQTRENEKNETQRAKAFEENMKRCDEAEQKDKQEEKKKTYANVAREAETPRNSEAQERKLARDRSREVAAQHEKAYQDRWGRKRSQAEKEEEWTEPIVDTDVNNESPGEDTYDNMMEVLVELVETQIIWTESEMYRDMHGIDLRALIRDVRLALESQMYETYKEYRTLRRKPCSKCDRKRLRCEVEQELSRKDFGITGLVTDPISGLCRACHNGDRHTGYGLNHVMATLLNGSARAVTQVWETRWLADTGDGAISNMFGADGEKFDIAREKAQAERRTVHWMLSVGHMLPSDATKMDTEICENIKVLREWYQYCQDAQIILQAIIQNRPTPTSHVEWAVMANTLFSSLSLDQLKFVKNKAHPDQKYIRPDENNPNGEQLIFEFVHNVQTIKHFSTSDLKSGKFAQSVEWWRKFAIRLGGAMFPDRAEKTRILQILRGWEQIATEIGQRERISLKDTSEDDPDKFD